MGGEAAGQMTLEDANLGQALQHLGPHLRLALGREGVEQLAEPVDGKEEGVAYDGLRAEAEGREEGDAGIVELRDLAAEDGVDLRQGAAAMALCRLRCPTRVRTCRVTGKNHKKTARTEEGNGWREIYRHKKTEI